MQKELEFQNKKISYSIEGKGRPVMLVHGFAEDYKIWNKQVDHLKKSFQLILPDLPGSGNSELLDEVSMETMAEVLHAVLGIEGITACTMIGHSMGGYVTLAFAEKYAGSLTAFSLFHSTAYADTEEKKETRRKGIEFIRKNGAEEFLKATVPNLFAREITDDGPRTTTVSKQAMIQKLINDYKDFKAESLIAYYEAMMRRPDRIHVLKSFTKPILFLLGQYDTAVPYDQGIQQSLLAVSAEVHTLHRSGHMGMWEEPERCNMILEAFIKNNVR